MKENPRDEQIEIELRINRRDLSCDAHHLGGVLDQTAAAGMMISACTSGVAKARPVLRDELGTERVKPRITNRRRGRDDEFPIRCEPGARSLPIPAEDGPFPPRLMAATSSGEYRGRIVDADKILR